MIHWTKNKKNKNTVKHNKNGEKKSNSRKKAPTAMMIVIMTMTLMGKMATVRWRMKINWKIDRHEKIVN